MKNFRQMLCLAALALTCATLALAEESYSWRYYRKGNTGIQGDWNESLWLGPDGDPWIGGYDPFAEEGGVAKFVQAENRWVNVSNIDYPVIGDPEQQGMCRVTDMVADGLGNLWMGTWRGVLRMNLAAGPSSLQRFGPGNSGLPGGLTQDVTRAPDGSIWISASSSIWGGGGLTRYQPGTNSWTHINGHGGLEIAAQPKPGGGYYLWASGEGFTPMERWDSTTQTWNSYPATSGNPSHLVSLDSVDDAGNVWMRRWIGVQGEETLDCLRPDGTWVTPPLPPVHPQVGVAALRAFGTMQALMVDGYAHLHRFDGAAWTDLGAVPHNSYIDDLDIDESGNVWLCGTGTGGALRRDAETGVWQRYRITNTSQFDSFNQDLAIDAATGDVYACANASPDYGGMVRFDGIRWTGFVNGLGYGLTEPWPWPGAPQSEAVYVRPSNGHVVANPINNFTHEFDGTSWTALPGGSDQVEQYVEDSLGRLWGMGHYGGLGIYENGGFTLIDTGGWSGRLQVDPDRPGTVWANEDWKVLRTDGTYSFSFTPDEVPGVIALRGLAADHGGICWVGASTNTGGALIRIDANTGSHEVWRSDEVWPFPADFLVPERVTPDGRLWLTYSGPDPTIDSGLLWWDGTQVGIFPTTLGATTGLPYGYVDDMEVKAIPGGYELWMSCLSRGIAVLTVEGSDPASVDVDLVAPTLMLEQNSPNPFSASTRVAWSIPEAGRVRVAVFDVAGRVIRVLHDGATSAGRHEVLWDGRTEDGRVVANGLYFYRLDRAGEHAERRMIFLK